jgi:hypothetical protein
MPATLASQIVLSATGFLLKTWLALGTKSVKIEGLPILLEALREKEGYAVDLKGKGKERVANADALGSTEKLSGRGRRGVVTGSFALDECIINGEADLV